MPNTAKETAKKAKWYHIVTEKIRVRDISSMSKDKVVKNIPKYTDFMDTEIAQ
jgi:hypothetical protein